MVAFRACVAVLACVSISQAVDQQLSANPIRKVSNMLQGMQKKVQAEGEKEAELYDKFMCYCKSSGSDLTKSIGDSGTKVPALASSITEAEEKKKQLDEEIMSHMRDRTAAETAMGEATSIREKDVGAFNKDKAEWSANIDALKKALGAVESGMTGSFLQTGTAQKLKQLILNRDNIQDSDRQDVLSFLSGSQSEFMPQSGEILGILKNIRDDMVKSLAGAEKAEAAAIAEYDDLMAVRKKQVDLSQEATETKHMRVGELAVDIIEMKNELTDAEAQLLEDKKFLADLDGKCAAQTKEWELRQQTRSEELLALAETLKVLNDDDALELFKKTLPATSASFLQLEVNMGSQRKNALVILQGTHVGSSHRPQLDFITLALKGKSQGFEKVIKMIDTMTKTLNKEGLDDEHKKEYCDKQFDFTGAKRKGLKKTVSDLEISVDESTEGMDTLATEIKALTASIKGLDASVADATEQRKDEHETFTQLRASDAAAKELLRFVMNRLAKFYTPELYKPPPKRELSEQDQITVNMGGTLAPTAAAGGIAGTGVSFVQIHAHEQEVDAPPPPPATLKAYSKKSDEGGGVMAMIKLLIKDLGKEMDEAEKDETDSQSEYEKMLSDAAEKRAVDSKALTQKNSARAALETDVEEDTEAKESHVKELMATEKYMASLHSECDWLLQYFDVRAEARASEVDSLRKAKSVLSGADFSLLQEKSVSKGFMQPRA